MPIFYLFLLFLLEKKKSVNQCPETTGCGELIVLVFVLLIAMELLLISCFGNITIFNSITVSA